MGLKIAVSINVFLFCSLCTLHMDTAKPTVTRLASITLYINGSQTASAAITFLLVYRFCIFIDRYDFIKIGT